MNDLNVHMVSPEALLLSTTAHMVTAPGAEGEFGVLKDHAPFVAQLRAGVVEVQRTGEAAARYFIPGGFAQVEGDTCTLLVDSAVVTTELNATLLRGAYEEHQRTYRETTDDAEKAKILADLELLEAKIAAAQH